MEEEKKDGEFLTVSLIPRFQVNPTDNPEMFSLKINIHRILVPGDLSSDPPGVYFHNVQGDCVSGATSTSFSNEKEAQVVGSLYRKLTGIKIRPTDIGIITPYKDQVRRLQGLIESSAVTIGSVDSFQGQERSVIIVSTVRSSGGIKGIGFVACQKRLNVTLSRAKIALIIVGDGAHLSQNSGEFRHLLQKAMNKLTS